MHDRAVFLDRDGTINEEVGYLHEIEALRFIQGVPQAIRLFNERQFKVIVVTNQAGVARGYYEESAVDRIHAAIQKQLRAHHARIDAFFYCPHHPTEGMGGYKKACNCRKPKSGMLERAALQLGVDLGKSFMIGDKLSDLETGAAAGCGYILVRTGYGRKTEQSLGGRIPQPDFIADNLLDASRWILRQNG